MKTLVLEYWTPLLVWLLTIFFVSTDSFSSGQTSRFIGPLLIFIFPGLSQAEIEVWHGIIRKFAHIVAYFILAGFAHRSLKYQLGDLVQAKVRTIAFVLLAACIDEFHQSLTASRGASIVDVGYDCLGGVWALWLITSYETRRLYPHTVL